LPPHALQARSSTAASHVPCAVAMFVRVPRSSSFWIELADDAFSRTRATPFGWNPSGQHAAVSDRRLQGRNEPVAIVPTCYPSQSQRRIANVWAIRGKLKARLQLIQRQIAAVESSIGRRLSNRADNDFVVALKLIAQLSGFQVVY
jgi:hypothetical protein